MSWFCQVHLILYLRSLSKCLRNKVARWGWECVRKKTLYSRGTETCACLIVLWILVMSALPGLRPICLKDLRLLKRACSLESKFTEPGEYWGICALSGDLWAQILKQVYWLFCMETSTCTGAAKGNLDCSSASVWKNSCLSQLDTALAIALAILHLGTSLTFPYKAVHVHPTGVAFHPKGPSRGQLPQHHGPIVSMGGDEQLIQVCWSACYCLQSWVWYVGCFSFQTRYSLDLTGYHFQEVFQYLYWSFYPQFWPEVITNLLCSCEVFATAPGDLGHWRKEMWCFPVNLK